MTLATQRYNISLAINGKTANTYNIIARSYESGICIQAQVHNSIVKVLVQIDLIKLQYGLYLLRTQAELLSLQRNADFSSTLADSINANPM